MNSKLKMILTICATVMLVTSCIMGTLALLSDSDEVVNTFTVGKVAITLDEAAVNTDGTPIEGAMHCPKLYGQYKKPPKQEILN